MKYLTIKHYGAFLQYCPPQFLLHERSCSALLPNPAALFVASVVLLDKHRGTPALLKFLLLIVTSKLALDEDCSLCHLFIKCILQNKGVVWLKKESLTFCSILDYIHSFSLLESKHGI